MVQTQVPMSYSLLKFKKMHGFEHWKLDIPYNHEFLPYELDIYAIDISSNCDSCKKTDTTSEEKPYMTYKNIPLSKAKEPVTSKVFLVNPVFALKLCCPSHSIHSSMKLIELLPLFLLIIIKCKQSNFMKYDSKWHET